MTIEGTHEWLGETGTQNTISHTQQAIKLKSSVETKEILRWIFICNRLALIFFNSMASL